MNGTWIPDNWGLQDGEEVGGDYQVTNGYSRRYLLADENGQVASRVYDGETLYSMVTIYWYAVTRPDCDSEDGIARDSDGEPVIWLVIETERLTCTNLDDPGGTERWDGDGNQYDDDMDIFYESVEAAEKHALHMAEAYTTELANRDIGWDGLAPWERKAT